MGDSIITAVATLLAVVIGGRLTYQWTARLEEQKVQHQELTDQARLKAEEARIDRQYQREEAAIRKQLLSAILDDLVAFSEAQAATLLDIDNGDKGRITYSALDRLQVSVLRSGDPVLWESYGELRRRWFSPGVHAWREMVGELADGPISDIKDRVSVMLHGENGPRL